jgi:Fe2+ or Zn2+ uptake regulation protein
VEAAKAARARNLSIEAIGEMFKDSKGRPASRQTIYRALGMLSDAPKPAAKVPTRAVKA